MPGLSPRRDGVGQVVNLRPIANRPAWRLPGVPSGSQLDLLSRRYGRCRFAEDAERLGGAAVPGVD